MVALREAHHPAQAALPGFAVFYDLFRIDDGIRVTDGLEVLQKAVHLHFVIFGEGAVRPAADLLDGVRAHHHALPAHVEGHALLHAVEIPHVVEKGIVERRAVAENAAALFIAQIVFDALAGEIDVRVHIERVVELFHIVGGEHGVRVHDAVGGAVLPMLLPDALEEPVERGALARLFGHDKDGEPELFRHLHGGIVRALHDDVDIEVFAVIRLPQDGIEEIADDAALVAGGDEERDAPLFAGIPLCGREKAVQKLHELGDIQKRGKKRRRTV